MQKIEKIKRKFENKSTVVSIRLTKEEKTLLENKMEKDGWKNISGYIKTKILKTLS